MYKNQVRKLKIFLLDPKNRSLKAALLTILFFVGFAMAIYLAIKVPEIIEGIEALCLVAVMIIVVYKGVMLGLEVFSELAKNSEGSS
jgi:uncharacterized membrane protein